MLQLWRNPLCVVVLEVGEEIKAPDIVSRDQMPTDNSLHLNKCTLSPTHLPPHARFYILLCLSHG